MAGDVLEKNESCLGLSADSGDVGPEVAWVVGAGSAAGDGEGLARVARSDAIHHSTPRPTVKGCEVIPDRRWSQASLFHARCQNCGRMRFPLHKTDRLSCSACGKVKGEVEAANPGT